MILNACKGVFYKIMKRKKNTSIIIKQHWNRISELGCIITGSPFPTIHHIHGGSVKDIGIHKGLALKTSGWLVLPIRWDYHLGAAGIDSGVMSVREWEARNGTQVEMLDKLCIMLNMNCWKKANIDRKIDGIN